MAPGRLISYPPYSSSSSEESTSDEESESYESVPLLSQHRRPVSQKLDFHTESEDSKSKSESEGDSDTDSDTENAAIVQDVKPVDDSPAKSKAGPASRGGETEEASGVKRRKEGGSVENFDDSSKKVTERSSQATEPSNAKAKSSKEDTYTESEELASESDSEDDSDSDSEDAALVQNVKPMEVSPAKSSKDDLQTESEELVYGSESEEDSDSASDSEDAAIVQNVEPMEDSPAKSKAGASTPRLRKRSGETEQLNGVKRQKEGGSVENSDDFLKRVRERSSQATEPPNGKGKSSNGDNSSNDFLMKLRERSSQVTEPPNGKGKGKSSNGDSSSNDFLKKLRERSSQATEPPNGKGKSSNGDSSKLAELGVGNGGGDVVEIEKQEKGNSWFSLDWALGKKSIAQLAAAKGLDHLKGPKRVELERRWRELHIASIKLIVERSELLQETMLSLNDSGH